MVKLEAFLELFLQAHAIRQPARDLDLNQALFACQGKQAIDAHPGQPQLLADFSLRVAANKIEPGRPGGQLLFRIKS